MLKYGILQNHFLFLYIIINMTSCKLFSLDFEFISKYLIKIVISILHLKQEMIFLRSYSEHKN